MKDYNPNKQPDAEEWLALDESERIDLVFRHHRQARIQLPNARLHAVLHVIVENQVALGDEIPVRRHLERLQTEGLDRHEAVHAVATVLIKHIHKLAKNYSLEDDLNQISWAELEQLTAKSWRHSG